MTAIEWGTIREAVMKSVSLTPEASKMRHVAGKPITG